MRDIWRLQTPRRLIRASSRKTGDSRRAAAALGARPVAGARAGAGGRRQRAPRGRGGAGRERALPRLGHADVRADDAAELVTELREELAEERVARARLEGELAATGVLVADLRARADRLEADLRELRRPLVLRLLDGLLRRRN